MSERLIFAFVAAIFFILPNASAADVTDKPVVEVACDEMLLPSTRRHYYRSLNEEPEQRRRHVVQPPEEEAPPLSAQERNRIEQELYEEDLRYRLNQARQHQEQRDFNQRLYAWQNSTYEGQERLNIMAQQRAARLDALRYGTY